MTFETLKRQIGWWAGLVAALSAAFMGQGHAIPEPWNHVVAGLGTAAGVVCAYCLQPTRRRWSPAERMKRLKS